MSLHELLVAPVADYGFMRYGMAAAVMVGITSAVVSCLLVVRRQSLLGDAISHSVLLGVVGGWLLGGQAGLLWGALAAGVATGALTTVIERNSRVKPDAAMGVVFTTAFALGLAVISVVQPAGIDLFHVLLGNVLGAGNDDLLLIGITGSLVVAVIAVRFADFHVWSFDPTLAATLGVATARLHYVYITLLSATVVAALQAVGLVLVIALLVTPGATALLIASRLATMMRMAAALAVVAAVAGMYSSFHLDVAPGPSIVLNLSAMFLIAYLFAPHRGIAVKAFRRAGRRAGAETS